MRFCFEIFMLASLAKISVAEYVSYDSYRVYQVIINSKEQYGELLTFNENDEGFEIFFDRSPENSARIIVPPDKLSKFLDFLTKNNLGYKLEIENLQCLIDAERSRILSTRNSKFDWENYHPLPKVYAWLDELERKYVNVKVITIGKSFQGRNITGIEINNGRDLPGVVIESGIHAREWITIAGTSWVINEILKSSEPIWKKFNYLYFPSYNPDGYVYSWTRDRLWRKTRSKHLAGLRICYGVDGNRNWDSDWGGLGSSSYPCSPIYRGPQALSEPETKYIARYLTKVAKRRKNKIYLSYHSYGQLLEFPYGYTNKTAPHYEIWKRVAKKAGEAYTKVHGKEIKIGHMYSPRNSVSGDSTDWYYEKLNATISFLYEMRDRGVCGFILPPEEIIPVGEEQLASLKVVLEEYQKLPASDF